MENGKLKMENGKWKVESGKLFFESTKNKSTNQQFNIYLKNNYF